MIYEYTNDLPIVTASLYHAGQTISIQAVVDSGAMVSVLPYEDGVELGFIWEEQTLPVRLGGAGQGVPAYGILVRGELAGIPPVALAFAWTRKTREEIRPLLGYTNFFQQFTVILTAYTHRFEIIPKNQNGVESVSNPTE